MTDLYQAVVLERGDLKTKIRLSLTQSARGYVPIGAGFASLLIAEECSPVYDAFDAWVSQRWEEDEDYDWLRSIQSVSVLAFSIVDSETFDSKVDVEIEVDTPGLLNHLAPGTTWWSTACDEHGNDNRFFVEENKLVEWSAKGI